MRGFTTRSNIARENAELVAICACEGWITTRVTKGIYSSEWRPTVAGLILLNESELENG